MQARSRQPCMRPLDFYNEERGLTELTKQRLPRLTSPLAVVSMTGPPSPTAAPTLSSWASDDGLTFLPEPPTTGAFADPLTAATADAGGVDPGGGLSRAAHETGAFLTAGGAGAVTAGVAGAGEEASSAPLAGEARFDFEVTGDEGAEETGKGEVVAAEERIGETEGVEAATGVGSVGGGGGGGAGAGETTDSDAAGVGADSVASEPALEGWVSSATCAGSGSFTDGADTGSSWSCASFSFPFSLAPGGLATPNVSVSTADGCERDCSDADLGG